MPAGNIWLIGMMGAGKSAVGRALARVLSLEYADTDADIAARVGCSVGQLWGTLGESAFREMEAARIAELADRSGRVVATGGGAVLRDDNLARMKGSGRLFWLVAPPEVLSERVQGGSGRPLLEDDAGPRRIAELLEARHERYHAAADWRIETSERTPEETAADIAELWNAS